MPPTASESTLPVTVEDITGPESFVDAISKLAACIHKAVNEGNSVTRANKLLICLATEEIRKAARIFQNLRPNGTSSEQGPPFDSASVKEDIVSSVREEISRQLNAFAKKQEKRQEKQSYAEVTAICGGTAPASQRSQRSTPALSTKPVTKPALVVTPRVQTETREEAVRKFRECINFKVAKYAPARIVPLSNHKLRVEFDDVNHRDDALSKLNKSPVLSAEPARKLSPMFLLKGISCDTSPDELIDIIKYQNVDLHIEKDDDLRLRFKRDNRNPKLYNAVFLASPSVWRKAVERGRLLVDFQQVHVEDFSPFLQCYRCFQFGHTRNKCSAKDSLCDYCAAAGHSSEECPEKDRNAMPKCLNCHAHNDRFKTKADVRHRATSSECPRLMAMKERITNRIDYGSTH